MGISVKALRPDEGEIVGRAAERDDFPLFCNQQTPHKAFNVRRRYWLSAHQHAVVDR